MKTIRNGAIFLMVAAVLTGSATGVELFITSDHCMACHNGLTDPSGDDISFGANWRGSMMANAARDPYWQAAVRRETLIRPWASDAIQHECSKCHMPMSRFSSDKATGNVFDHLPIVQRHAPADFLAADGVSCTVCHQIGEEKLGEPESFSAGFALDRSTPLGQRQLFGPYQVDDGRAALMQSAGLFKPTEEAHIQSSELCATCHTLFTHALGDDGEVLATFPEQVPYLEWRHSSYAGSKSCQSCHMPEVQGDTPISSVLGEDRANVSRHVFRGGNFFMPKILNRHRADLGVQAPASELAAVSIRTKSHLESSSATLTIEGAQIDNGRLAAEVVSRTATGHKLPTAYPSSRVWIHFMVRDGEGRVVFESGRLEPSGQITGNSNDLDGGKYEPHYDEISNPDQVQIYEAIMSGSDDHPTTVLLSAVRYLKDNRLLPDGFDKETAEKDIAVAGTAAEDENFQAGGDRVRYSVDVSASDGPYTVQVELWYQPVAYRWAHNLGDRKATEIERFVSYYKEHASSSAVILARQEATTE